MEEDVHIMVDLETLGVEVDSVIVSISAVTFSLGKESVTNGFEANVDIQSSLDNGRKIYGDTLSWWMSQEKEALGKTFNNKKEKHSIHASLNTFKWWLSKQTEDLNNLYIWGNSNRVDLGMLAYKNPNPGWHHWNERDVRTLVSLAPQFKKEEPFVGTKHYGIDDCKHQIKYVKKTWDYLKRAVK